MLRLTCLIAVALGWATLGHAQEVGVARESQPIGPIPLERFARRIEPTLAGRADRLPQYVDFFRRELVSDARLFAFDVAAKAGPDGRVKLRGYVEFPETHGALVNYLGVLGFEVDDQLESLPAAHLGERRFGFMKTSHTLSYDRPSGRRGVVTDCLLGEPLYLLRADAGHFLVHSGEGYLGYVRAADVHRVNEAEFTRYLDGPRVRMTSDYEIDEGRVIPAGARLKWVTTVEATVTAELPAGELVSLPADCCEVRHVPAAEIDSIIENAQRLLGTPYLWGGKTSQGVDCSGLVQIGFATAGLYLPRDSNQQVYLGQLTATRWHTAGMRRGDTLYFLGSDGKIRHTGLYLGDDQFLQAISPVVVISSFNPEHQNYDAVRHASFAFAKRLVE
jgi:hypothetical protein